MLLQVRSPAPHGPAKLGSPVSWCYYGDGLVSWLNLATISRYHPLQVVLDPGWSGLCHAGHVVTALVSQLPSEGKSCPSLLPDNINWKWPYLQHQKPVAFLATTTGRKNIDKFDHTRVGFQCMRDCSAFNVCWLVLNSPFCSHFFEFVLLHLHWFMLHIFSIPILHLPFPQHHLSGLHSLAISHGLGSATKVAAPCLFGTFFCQTLRCLYSCTLFFSPSFWFFSSPDWLFL